MTPISIFGLLPSSMHTIYDETEETAHRRDQFDAPGPHRKTHIWIETISQSQDRYQGKGEKKRIIYWIAECIYWAGAHLFPVSLGFLLLKI